MTMDLKSKWPASAMTRAVLQSSMDLQRKSQKKLVDQVFSAAWQRDIAGYVGALFVERRLAAAVVGAFRMRARCFVVAFVGCLPACGVSPHLPSVASPAPANAPPAASAQTLATAPATSASPAAATPAASAPPSLQAEPLALPGAVGSVSLDFIFYEPQKSRVWVPAGGTGSVDVFDIASHAFSRVNGFKTVAREAHGKTRVVGPSAGAIGDGFAYIGNRATQEVCAVDLLTLKTSPCLKLSAATDGVEYVAATHEVWVTTPHTQSLVVLDASKAGSLKQKAVIKLPGEPEGYAVDDPHGLFLTNLED